jgi:hypothetical protein
VGLIPNFKRFHPRRTCFNTSTNLPPRPANLFRQHLNSFSDGPEGRATYAPDIVDQGTETVDRLGAEIWGSHYWFF